MSVFHTVVLPGGTYQLIRTYRYGVSTASNRCSQSPSHSQIILYERDWLHGRNSCLKFDVVHSTGRLDWHGFWVIPHTTICEQGKSELSKCRLNELCCKCTVHRWNALELNFPLMYGTCTADEIWFWKSEIMTKAQ